MWKNHVLFVPNILLLLRTGTQSQNLGTNTKHLFGIDLLSGTHIIPNNMIFFKQGSLCPKYDQIVILNNIDQQY